ncbi:hypothetical protein ACFVZH_38300 [Streptomyces sp. NPDC059534]|uniref:hypothetical protein n=1 Tax=Streptomyces sp. NPDC059534 TaxID=3346859 RepID=UPI003695E8E1
MASDDSDDSVDLVEMIRELMLVVRPAGTHLSQSSTPGGSSALVRDDDNVLVTHSVLYPADDELAAATAAATAEGVKAGVAMGIKVGIAVGVAVSATVGIVALNATPHVKTRFNDLKSKLKRKPQDPVDRPDEAGPEQPDHR